MNRPRKPTEALLVAAVVVLAALAYLPSLRGEFLNWDDDFFIGTNPRIRRLDAVGIVRLFTTAMPVDDLPGQVSYEYYPIRDLSLALDYHMWGTNPLGYHLTNLVIHLISVILVWLILRDLGADAPVRTYATLLFSIHPINVEPVAWVSARKDLAFLLFFLLSVHLYLRHINEGKPYLFVLSLFSALLSVLSKLSAILLPAVIAFCLYVSPRRPRRTTAGIHILLFFLIMWGATFTFNPAHRADLSMGAKGLGTLLIDPFIFVSSLSKLVAPFHLSAVYGPLNHPLATAAMVFIILGSCILIPILSPSPAAAFSLFWLVIQTPLLIHFGPSGFNIADRYLYASTIGYSFLLSTIVIHELRGRMRTILAGTIAGSLLILTTSRIPAWHDDLSLWEDAAVKSGFTPLALVNLGGSYERAGMLDRAESVYMKVIEHPSAPGDNAMQVLALRNLGALHIREKEYGRAVQELERAVSLYPGFADAHRFLGALYLKIFNDKEKGLYHLKKSLELAPRQDNSDMMREYLEHQGSL